MTFVELQAGQQFLLTGAFTSTLAVHTSVSVRTKQVSGELSGNAAASSSARSSTARLMY